MWLLVLIPDHMGSERLACDCGRPPSPRKTLAGSLKMMLTSLADFVQKRAAGLAGGVHVHQQAFSSSHSPLRYEVALSVARTSRRVPMPFCGWMDGATLGNVGR